MVSEANLQVNASVGWCYCYLTPITFKIKSKHQQIYFFQDSNVDDDGTFNNGNGVEMEVLALYLAG